MLWLGTIGAEILATSQLRLPSTLIVAIFGLAGSRLSWKKMKRLIQSR